MGGGRKIEQIRYIFSEAHSTIIIFIFCENWVDALKIKGCHFFNTSCMGSRRKSGRIFFKFHINDSECLKMLCAKKQCRRSKFNFHFVWEVGVKVGGSFWFFIFFLDSNKKWLCAKFHFPSTTSSILSRSFFEIQPMCTAVYPYVF